MVVLKKNGLFMVKKLLLILDLRNFLICDILKKNPEGGTTNFNLEKTLNFSEGRNISGRNEE